MPATSAKVKVDAVRAYGGHVELIDAAMKSRAERVSELARDHPEAYVASAYDDVLVIEGNASLGRELAALDPTPDIIVAPVGGGGLSSGIILGIRESGKNIRVIGAEPLLGNDAALSLRADKIIARDYLKANEGSKVQLEHLVKPGNQDSPTPYHFVLVRVDGDKLDMQVVVFSFA